MKAKVELKVAGMTCSGCVRSIEMKLSGMTGVSYAHVNLGEGKATVEYEDAQTDPANLLAAVNQLGFEASQS